MRLVELVLKQEVIVQLTWGDQKIEFSSEVIDKVEDTVLVTPCLHNGSALELNVNGDKGVFCNVFANKPISNQRVSWKNVELSTIDRNNSICYCLKTRGFNNVANPDDRRIHERVIVDVDGQVFNEQANEGGTRITVHDVSDIGLSFYVANGFAPKSNKVVVAFTDSVGARIFDILVECSVSRTNSDNGRVIVGCRVDGENRNYKIYSLIRRLATKNNNKVVDMDKSEAETETDSGSEE